MHLFPTPSFFSWISGRFSAAASHWVYVAFGLAMLPGLLPAQSTYLFSGRISGAGGQALAYASIAVDEARYGTLTDAEGNFQLRLPAGRHVLVLSHLGYRRLRDTIELRAPLHKTYSLVEEQLVLEEVLISADGRDPAYGIIRQAIKNKKKNARPFPQYTYKAYTKTTIRFQEGFEIDSLLKMAQIDPNSSNSGSQPPVPLEMFKSDLLFLSENVSEVAVKEPNQVKEKIVSSRVSGNSRQFSFMGNVFNRFDPYKNLQVMQGVANRGLVSPVADNAFFFYDYKLLGTIQEPGYKAYKIQLLPKRKHDPVYNGIIYIADSSYAIKEIDWVVTKTQQIETLDTLVIQQEYQPLHQAWLPFKSRVHLAFNFNMLMFRIPFSGSSTSLMSDYNVQPAIPKGFFNNELIAISDSALEHSRSYWEGIRPLPLTAIELKDYQYKDSLEQVLTSPEYLDSLTRVNRKIKPLDLLLGKEIRNYRTENIWRIKSMLNTFGFNAIEGWFLAAGVEREWKLDKGRSVQIGPTLRYSFGDRKFSYRLDLRYRGSGKYREQLQLSGGDFISQFSRFPQISLIENTSTALFAHDSYIRLYRKRFAELNYSRELFNGFTFTGNLRYEDRLPMSNTSEYSFFQREKRYAPNIPLTPHKAFIAELQLSLLPFNRYISIPNGKFNLGSKFPLLQLTYTHAPALFGDASSDFSHLRATISQQTRLGLLGSMNWRVTAGKFLHTRKLHFPDQFHFKGNQTPYNFTGYDGFMLLPYYRTSGTQPFVEAHLEHAFSGFITNKLPGIRRLKLREYVGLHYLIQQNGRPYLELNAGLEKMIFKVFPFRIDLNTRLMGDYGAARWGFKVVLPLQSFSGS